MPLSFSLTVCGVCVWEYVGVCVGVSVCCVCGVRAPSLSLFLSLSEIRQQAVSSGPGWLVQLVR